jgi:nicotinate-nucleotide pyrophosphorylase (carboxylating)
MNRPRELDFPTGTWLDQLVAQSLAEDVGPGDVSTAIAVDPSQQARGVIVARSAGVVAGLPLVALLYRRVDRTVDVAPLLTDGTTVTPGAAVAQLRGPAAALLTGERTALNFLQHLSGIATLTARYVAAVAGTGCRVLDTRKTLPGYRALAKYAVRAGGGHNHRLGLYDRIMLKDNHWAAGRPVEELVTTARRRHRDLAVEIEVDTLAQLDRVLPLQVEWILLDNFTPEEVAVAVRRRDAAPESRHTLLEASGGITLETVGTYAAAKADAVSVGRLTHSAPALDLAFEMELIDDPERNRGPHPQE